MSEFHVEVSHTAQSAAQLLALSSGLSIQQIKQAMKKGAVWVTSTQGSSKRLRRADKTLEIGQSLHLYHDDKVLSESVEPAVLMHDEEDYSVWYKPYGMLSQGSKWGDHCTINRWIELNHTPQRPAFIVNRLDRAAQGLMLIAHTKAAAKRLSGLFEERKIYKVYTAKVAGHFPNDLVIDQPINGKQAHSYARLLSYDSKTKNSLVSIDIATGRKHQIRKHLSGAGFPIIGDRLYGMEDHQEIQNLCLVSTHLAFRCPLNGADRNYRLSGDYLPKHNTSANL